MPIQLIDHKTKGPTSLFLGLALLLVCLTLFICNSGMTLWDDDEAAYAGFAMNMLETGNWINPDFQWAEVHRKTPFHFWTISISYYIFGINEFAVRFPSIMAVLGSILLLRFWGRSVFGQVISDWASIIFSTSLLVISMGKMSLTDAWLMFFETTAILALLNFIEKPNWRWNLALWSSISLGILVKGPPIIIVVGGIWVMLAIFHPKAKQLIATHPWFYGILALIPFGGWCYASYLNDGGKLLTFLYEWYIVERIGGSVFGQTGPPGYHFVIALIAFFPWLPFFFRGLWKVFRYARKNSLHISIFSWLLFAWLFFELMSSKLPSYAMAAHPAFALAIALSLVDFLKKDQKWPKWEIYLMTFVSLLLSLGLYFGAKTSFPSAYWALFSTIPLSLIAVSFPFLKKNLQFAWPWLFSASLLFTAWGFGINLLHQSPAMSSRRIIHQFQQKAPKEVETIAVCGISAKQLRVSFMFYLQEDWGNQIQEWEAHETISALQTDQTALILVGETAWSDIKYAIDQGKITAEWGELPEWWSYNDQLKAHPFYWVRHAQSQ